MSNYITTRYVAKDHTGWVLLLGYFSFRSVFNMTKKLEHNYMVESALVICSNASQWCGKVLITLESHFVSYLSALGPHLVQSLLTQHVWHIILKPLVFQFWAILQLILYEIEKEIFLLLCLAIPWILEMQFKSSSKSQWNYFGVKGRR